MGKKKRLKELTLIFSVLLLQFSYSQNKIVTGIVRDNKEMPMPGVNILIVGTSSGTQTDIDGIYTIQVEVGNTIRFSYVGYRTQNIVVATSNIINLVMEEEVSDLDEIIVIGYGTQSKRFITDNIVKLKASDIVEIPTPNVFNAIAGKAAGIQVNQANGKVESGLNFRIRGQTSISAGNNPLYVLDGIPLINTDESKAGRVNPGRTNPLITLSANEIESIDILKDASAAAIYGSRGANGVVVITTKRGRQGKTKFNVNFSNGVSEPAKKLNWLNAEQYVELLLESAQKSPLGDDTDFVTERFDNISNGTWQDGTYDTDWQDFALINGHVRDADFSMSGGNETTRFYFSGAYNDTKGIIDGNELDRISVRLNIDHDFSKRITLGMNIAYSRTNIDRVASDGSFVSPLQTIAQAPISPALIDGEPFDGTLYPNYLLEDKYSSTNSKFRRITGKVFGEYRFNDLLKWRSEFGYDYYSQIENYFGGLNTPFNSATNGYSYLYNIDTENYIFSNYLTYDKTFNEKHNLNVVLGTELNKSNKIYSSVEGTEFPSNDFQTIDSAANIVGGGSGESAYSFVSYFIRGTYKLLDKYLFKASLRRDGSSRFGKNNQFGTFPALSVGWLVSEEDFMNDSKVFSLLKLRTSWGITGNAEIPNFAALSLFSGASYNLRPGLQLTKAGNDNLSWETTSQVDVAVEFGILNDSFRGEFAYYSKNTKDLLFNRPLPGSSGNPNGGGVTQNIGQLSNNGFEVSFRTINYQTETFTWTTNFNISNNNIKIKELASGEDVIYDPTILREEEAPNSFYLIEYAGVNPENGDALYFLNTENLDGSINRDTTNNPNEAQRIVAGQPLPKWISGLTNTLTYKDFDLNFTLSGEWGASIYNYAGIYQSSNGDWFDNQTLDQLDRWQNSGDITDVPEARFGGGNGAFDSTRYLESGDFVRLRNLTLGYRLPNTWLDKIGFDGCRIYLCGYNLFTITNFTGYDPESRNDDNFVKNGAEGLTFYSAPVARTYSLGVNLSF